MREREMTAVVPPPPPLLCLAPPANSRGDCKNPPLSPGFCRPRTPSKLCCIRNDGNSKASVDFSVLHSDFPCDCGSIWSTLAFYLLSLHVPLSFGGLSIVAHVLHQTTLHPETLALSLLILQTLELTGVFTLLKITTKSESKNLIFTEAQELQKERNWLLASVVGFGFLLALVFLTSAIGDWLIGPKDVNNPLLKEIISSGPLPVTAVTLVYCLVTPVLEETVYRGFLLTSLAANMEWKKAVVISSTVFSAAHFSADNFFQLFVVGSVLGCSFCWTGKLRSSILIHSLYNALVLLLEYWAVSDFL